MPRPRIVDEQGLSHIQEHPLSHQATPVAPSYQELADLLKWVGSHIQVMAYSGKTMTNQCVFCAIVRRRKEGRCRHTDIWNWGK